MALRGTLAPLRRARRLCGRKTAARFCHMHPAAPQTPRPQDHLGFRIIAANTILVAIGEFQERGLDCCENQKYPPPLSWPRDDRSQRGRTARVTEPAAEHRAGYACVAPLHLSGQEVADTTTNHSYQSIVPSSSLGRSHAWRWYCAHIWHFMDSWAELL